MEPPVSKQGTVGTGGCIPKRFLIWLQTVSEYGTAGTGGCKQFLNREPVEPDGKSDVTGKSGDRGGRRIMKKKKQGIAKIFKLRKESNHQLLNKKKKNDTQNDEEGEHFMSENGTTIELKEEVAKEQNGVRPKQESTAETNLNKDHLLPPSSNGGLKRAPSHMERARRLHTRQKRGQSVSFTHENMRKKKPPINDETEEGLQGLFHHLKIRQDKMRTEFQETAKWFKVATKMDRIFFWGYGISVTILTFYAFIFKPMQKNVEL